MFWLRKKGYVSLSQPQVFPSAELNKEIVRKDFIICSELDTWEAAMTLKRRSQACG